MPKRINHEDRKRLIWMTALDVFATNGYKDTNLSLIARKCNLARTSVYEYFKSTDEILSYAVKTVTDNMLEKYQDEKWHDIRIIIKDILDTADCHLNEISGLIQALAIKNLDLHTEVKRRTVQLRLALCRIIRNKKGSVYRDTNAEDVVNHLFTLVESYCFEKIYIGESEAEIIRQLVEKYLLDCLYL